MNLTRHLNAVDVELPDMPHCKGAEQTNSHATPHQQSVSDVAIVGWIYSHSGAWMEIASCPTLEAEAAAQGSCTVLGRLRSGFSTTSGKWEGGCLCVCLVAVCFALVVVYYSFHGGGAQLKYVPPNK